MAPLRRALVPLWISATLFSATAQSAADDAVALLALGRAIYQTGYRSDGSPVTATVQQDVPLPPGSGACASCHRRSGIGTAEGRSRSLNLTAPALFAATTKPPLRPAYDATTIARALVGGVSADGRSLGGLMPRYRLTDDDLQGLVAYLHTLGSEASPGVSATDLTVATIVAEDAPAGDRQALEAVLARYVAIKNAGTRREVERAAAADRHHFGLSRDRAYRRWQLDVWTLKGPASTWDAQLADYYEKNPPFAVLSGTTGHDWAVVHAFCENRRIPCVLPIAAAPPNASNDFYGMYYSSGVELDARVTAASVAADLAGEQARTLVLYHDNEGGRTASAALLAAWQRLGLPPFTMRAIDPSQAISSRDWSRLLAESRPTVLIAWLSTSQLAGLAVTPAGAKGLPNTVYTAESFTRWSGTPISAEVHSRVRHVYPYTLPRPDLNQFPREQAWLKSQKLESLPLLPAAQALFACHAFGEALSDMESTFSRDYLLETLEHSLDGTQMTSIYPATTLGPNQRTISRGGYVTEIGDIGSATPFVNAKWIEP